MHQKIINVTQFEDFTDPINQMEHRSWVFRGHGAVGWHIESSIGWEDAQGELHGLNNAGLG